MLEQSISSLAILKVNWDKKRQDYIENFIPFVSECLRLLTHDEISLPELQTSIKSNFGLAIPQGALKTILHRAEKHHYVTRSQGIYFRNLEVLPTTDFNKIRSDVLRQHEALIEKIRNFCNLKYSIQWTVEEAESAFLSYLQKSSIPILAAAIEGRPIPEPLKNVADADFLINSFIADLYQKDPTGFDFLETVVKGNMLATTLYLADIAKASKRFERLDIYLDTRFLLRALGLAGTKLQAPCIELINLLYQAGVTLSCFEHTLEEMRGILIATQHALENSSYRTHSYYETYEYFISININPSDVALIISGLEKQLHSLRIYVKEKPPYTTTFFGLDEKKLEDIIREELPNQKPEALRHDVDCFTAIHRLRKAKIHRDLESCRFIFLTTTTSLARASARFFKEEYNDIVVPLCVLDQFMATLVWIKNPSVSNEFSRKRIIADCYAALNPPSSLWKKYLEESESLRVRGNISEDDYHLLKYSMAARNALMEFTLGNTNVFTEGTIPEVLEVARAAARASTEAALDEERKKRDEAERKAASAEARLKSYELMKTMRVKKISSWCGRAIRKVSFVTIFGILALGLYSTLPASFPQMPIKWGKLLTPFLIFIVFVYSLYNWTYGVTIKSIIQKIEVKSTQFIENHIDRFIL